MAEINQRVSDSTYLLYAELVALLHLPPSAPHAGQNCGPVPAPLLTHPHTFQVETKDTLEAISLVEIVDLGVNLIDEIKVVDISLSWERAVASKPCELRWPHKFTDP